MRDETRMLLESLSRLLEDRCTKAVIDQAEAGTFASGLWAAVAAMGLAEAAGDAGAEWTDLFACLRVAGRHAAPVPLLETMLANWVGAAAGFAPGSGPMTVAPVAGGDRLTLSRDGGGAWRLSGRASRVPYARFAEAVVLIAEADDAQMAVRLPGPVEGITMGRNIAGEPRDTLVFTSLGVDGEAVRALPAEVGRAALYRRGALGRAVMMAGAMERAMELAVGYAQERVQFGRPISKFQAVQQNLAVLAGQTAAAVAAANLGIEALRLGDAERQLLQVALAKTRVGEAATLGCEIAHQVHGAIGFTREYALQAATRRLWSWREEFGPDAEWAARVGEAACAAGPEGLWPMLTA